jgi:hypothetical protein
VSDTICPPAFRLETLTDGQLHALLRQVQALLLDRPHEGSELAVDLIDKEETRLLALYRALPPLPRRGVVDLMRRGAPPCRQANEAEVWSTTKGGHTPRRKDAPTGDVRGSQSGRRSGDESESWVRHDAHSLPAESEGIRI